jgi:nucleoside-diphosphate-sugar epimerase
MTRALTSEFIENTSASETRVRDQQGRGDRTSAPLNAEFPASSREPSPRRVVVTGGSGFIGTHLIERLQANTTTVMNVDIAAPKVASHTGFWRQLDILDEAAFERAIVEFEPTDVVHMAARTDTTGRSLSDYAVNTTGTRNLLRAIRHSRRVRLVNVSSQFVVGPGWAAERDDDYRPHTLYGRSKALAEDVVRNAQFDGSWTIVRPTNIWGPWHPRYPVECWRIVRRGVYLHPGRQRVIRSYGYVRNVVEQIARILALPSTTVHRQTLYLGEEPIDVFEWVDAFSRALTGRPPRVVPRPVLMSVAIAGEGARRLGLPAPLFLSRYRSMTQDYPTPMARTFELLGPPEISLEQGVSETVGWLRSQDGFWCEPSTRARPARTRISLSRG